MRLFIIKTTTNLQAFLRIVIPVSEKLWVWIISKEFPVTKTKTTLRDFSSAHNCLLSRDQAVFSVEEALYLCWEGVKSYIFHVSMSLLLSSELHPSATQKYNFLSDDIVKSVNNNNRKYPC